MTVLVLRWTSAWGRAAASARGGHARRLAAAQAGWGHGAATLIGELPHRTALVAVTLGQSFQPTAQLLPGGHALIELVNGIGGWALILALAGLLIGAAVWALGSHSQNYQQSFVGRRAVIVSALAALIVGAAPAIVDFFFHTGFHIPVPAPLQ
jgi:hypothetical protein